MDHRHRLIALRRPRKAPPLALTGVTPVDRVKPVDARFGDHRDYKANQPSTDQVNARQDPFDTSHLGRVWWIPSAIVAAEGSGGGTAEATEYARYEAAPAAPPPNRSPVTLIERDPPDTTRDTC